MNLHLREPQQTPQGFRVPPAGLHTLMCDTHTSVRLTLLQQWNALPFISQSGALNSKDLFHGSDNPSPRMSPVKGFILMAKRI